MKTLTAEIPIQTVKRIDWLKEQTGLKEETIIISALITGTMELKKWLEEDD